MNTRTKAIALGLSAIIAAGGATACGSGSSSSASSPKASATPVASLTNLSGVHTQVILDSGFLAALKQLGVTPGLIGSATLDNGTLTFPITGGNATYYPPGSRDPYVTGMIMHDGSGITLTAGKTVVGLSNFVVDPGASMLTGKVTANGSTVAESAPLFFLNGSTLQPLQVDKATNTAVLYGTKVYLTKTAADLLNKTFNVTALSDQTLIGVAKITLKLS